MNKTFTIPPSVAIAGLLLLLIQISCTAQGQAVINDSFEIDQAATECAAAGGTYQPVCLSGKLFCVLPFSDAGKLCQGSEDCEGQCLGNFSSVDNTIGTCQSDNNPCGCFVFIERDEEPVGICID